MGLHCTVDARYSHARPSRAIAIMADEAKNAEVLVFEMAVTLRGLSQDESQGPFQLVEIAERVVDSAGDGGYRGIDGEVVTDLEEAAKKRFPALGMCEPPKGYKPRDFAWYAVCCVMAARVEIPKATPIDCLRRICWLLARTPSSTSTISSMKPDTCTAFHSEQVKGGEAGHATHGVVGTARSWCVCCCAATVSTSFVVVNMYSCTSCCGSCGLQCHL